MATTYRNTKTARTAPARKKTSKKLLPSKKKSASKTDSGKSFDKFKEYKGKRYTGMAIGRSHKWYYDKGEWK